MFLAQRKLLRNAPGTPLCSEGSDSRYDGLISGTCGPSGSEAAAGGASLSSGWNICKAGNVFEFQMCSSGSHVYLKFVCTYSRLNFQ